MIDKMPFPLGASVQVKTAIADLSMLDGVQVVWFQGHKAKVRDITLSQRYLIVEDEDSDVYTGNPSDFELVKEGDES